MRATLNDALVHWTLHPPKIPRISSAGPSKAGSTSASSADCGGASPVVPRSQYLASTAPFSSSTQQGRKRQERKGTVRHGALFGGSGRSGGKCQNAGVKVVLTVFRLCCGWGACLSAPWGHWQSLGAASWMLSALWAGYLILFRDSSPPLPHTSISFPTSWARSPRSLALCQIVEEMLSITALEIILDPGPGSPVAFSWWKR